MKIPNTNKHVTKQGVVKRNPAPKTLSYEIKESIIEDREIDKLDIFGGKKHETVTVGHKWTPVKRAYSDELLQICKEQEVRGNCRNIVVGK